MSCSTGWYNLAEAQFKIHRYSDSATSCSQGMLSLIYVARIAQKSVCNQTEEQSMDVHSTSMKLSLDPDRHTEVCVCFC